ncbi:MULTISPECIES: DUF5615 family PIN-like protein [unclassified Synechococcus]|nr:MULTISPECIES: DUF5615 family PIN-like protein [unclassified Synechococcus]
MGCDVLHTLDLPEGNRSSDKTISSIADHDGRVVFSKDADFIQSHLLRGIPARLLILTTGNISALPRIWRAMTWTGVGLFMRLPLGDERPQAKEGGRGAGGHGVMLAPPLGILLAWARGGCSQSGSGCWRFAPALHKADDKRHTRA